MSLFVELRLGSVAASEEPAIEMASFYVLDAMVTRVEGVTQLQALVEPVTVERSHRRRDSALVIAEGGYGHGAEGMPLGDIMWA
jgi:hypothetical protein